MPSVPIHLLSLALCLSSGFQQGYIASVLNQPYQQINEYINASWIKTTGSDMSPATLNLTWSLLNVCFPISTIFGQLAASFLVAYLGRKKTALLSCLLYIPGTLLSSAAEWIFPAFELLFVGRFIWGFSNGIASVNATVWIVECAPSIIRGRMAAMQEFFMAAGSLLTQALGVAFATDSLWWMMFPPNTIVVIINMILFFFVYESPQFLIEKKNDYDAARQSLAKYHGLPEDNEDIIKEIKLCEESIKKKKAKEDKVAFSKIEEAEASAPAGPSGMAIMFNPFTVRDPASKVIRQNAWVGLMVKVAYVFAGARSLRSYQSYVLHELGGWTTKQANLISLIVSLIRLPLTLVPVFLVDKVGRRPLLLISITISLASLILMEVAISIGPSWKIATMIGLTTLLLINTCGLGSISRFYCAEVVPRSILLQSVSILTAIEAASKIGVEFAFYPLAHVIGAQSLLMFTIPTAVFLVLMWFYCPETSQKTVDQVLNEVAAKRGLAVKF